MPTLFSVLNLYLCFFISFSATAAASELKINAHLSNSKADTDSEYDQALDSQKRRESLKDSRTPDLWKRVRQGFGLSGYEHRRVETELRWYARHPKYIDRVVDRATPFLYFIMTEIERRGMPAEIALLPVVESAFQPFAYSPGQAAGMWQFIPATGSRYGLKVNWWYDGRRDAIISTIAALNFLQDLHDHFDGDWLLALAAYNTGQGNVDRAIRRNLKKGKRTDFWSLNLPKETRDYVPKLLAIASIIDEPDAYSMKLAPIPDRPYLKSIQVHGQFDMAWVARMADIKINELLALNAAFNRWASPPNGPHRVILPIGPAETFLARLADADPSQRQKWTKHDVASGESLAWIARKYRTDAKLIKQVNKLTTDALVAGDSLLVPKPTNRTNSQLASGAESGDRIEHVVRSGDTIWDIANHYRVSVSDLANWNAMSPKDILVAGKKLVVWAQQQLEHTHLTANMVKHLNSSTTKKITYRVRRGDSLAKISDKFNVNIADILHWNRLEKDSFLYPGQQLRIVVDLTEQGG